MSAFVPGQRIEAKCTRCKDIMGHVIVSMLNGEVAKVECCACHSVHKYYPLEPKAKPVKEKPVRVRSGEVRAEAVKEKVRPVREPRAAAPKMPTKSQMQSIKAREELEQQWQNAVATNPSTPISYAMDKAFPLAGLVDHPVFGIGMVLSVTVPDKVEILFREGVKALRCKC